MRANVKPFTYWLIHKKYTARFSHRSPESVRGVLTTPEGEQDFDYNPATLTIVLPDQILSINVHGWETDQASAHLGDESVGKDDR
jgi:hypothetical protein